MTHVSLLLIGGMHAWIKYLLIIINQIPSKTDICYDLHIANYISRGKQQVISKYCCGRSEEFQ